jgi:hypothetical protein
MAYKQTPGRGNAPKTGNGIPSPLKQEIELTKKYEVGKKKLAENRAKGNTPDGLNINVRSGMATAKPYEKKFVENKKTGGASIIGGDNKTVATATRYGGGREVNELRKAYVKDSTQTMHARKSRAEFYNATSGGTSPDNLNTRQKKALVEIGKAKKTR